MRVLSGSEIRGVLGRERHPHPGFGWTALIVATLVVAFLVVVTRIGAVEGRYAEFWEGGSVGVLAALFHGMTAALAWATLLVGGQGRRARDAWFWGLLAGAFVFFGADEMLQFHERVGGWLHTVIGDAPGFRNWNDVVVLLYGAAGLVVMIRFRREIVRLPWFAEMLGVGLLFYGLSTGIDSLVASSALKNVPEESAKLIAAACFSLAGWAALLSIFAGRGDRVDVGG